MGVNFVVVVFCFLVYFLKIFNIFVGSLLFLYEVFVVEYVLLFGVEVFYYFVFVQVGVYVVLENAWVDDCFCQQEGVEDFDIDIVIYWVGVFVVCIFLCLVGLVGCDECVLFGIVGLDIFWGDELFDL